MDPLHAISVNAFTLVELPNSRQLTILLAQSSFCVASSSSLRSSFLLSATLVACTLSMPELQSHTRSSTMGFQWPKLDGAEVVICAPHDGHQWKLHEAYLRQHSTVFKELLGNGAPRDKKDKETQKPMAKYRLKMVLNTEDNRLATFRRVVSILLGS